MYTEVQYIDDTLALRPSADGSVQVAQYLCGWDNAEARERAERTLRGMQHKITIWEAVAWSFWQSGSGPCPDVFTSRLKPPMNTILLRELCTTIHLCREFVAARVVPICPVHGGRVVQDCLAQFVASGREDPDIRKFPLGIPIDVLGFRHDKAGPECTEHMRKHLYAWSQRRGQ